ncbi:5985_t:CDS:2 [Diversispora eburnea]|uniref:5985_t:CDS:1 n=1 Tax=Diversispora eburnea TaxID=1213867 RepID=A0A9N9ACI8_9GLOM|nr:5985_t:CDS:2 [Diversispora eburnea]
MNSVRDEEIDFNKRKFYFEQINDKPCLQFGLYVSFESLKMSNWHPIIWPSLFCYYYDSGLNEEIDFNKENSTFEQIKDKLCLQFGYLYVSFDSLKMSNWQPMIWALSEMINVRSFTIFVVKESIMKTLR